MKGDKKNGPVPTVAVTSVLVKILPSFISISRRGTINVGIPKTAPGKFATTSVVGIANENSGS